MASTGTAATGQGRGMNRRTHSAGTGSTGLRLTHADAEGRAVAMLAALPGGTATAP